MDPRTVASLPKPMLRSLHTLSRFPSVSHAARRLHCSQGVLLEQLTVLRRQLGTSAFRLVHGRVELHPDLSRILGEAMKDEPSATGLVTSRQSKGGRKA
jgi:DNA-binding transcriptional LysR family regulator